MKKKVKDRIIDAARGLLILVGGISGMMVFWYFYQKYQSIPYKEKGTVYTIAHVTKVGSGKGRQYYFWFKYKGKEFHEHNNGISTWSNPKRVRRGDKGYIMFPKGMPEEANMFTAYMLPDHMEEVSPPRQGWTLGELQKLDTLFDPDDHYKFFEPRLDAE